MLYVITDTHLGHRAMCHSCGRPENFSEQICHNWQNVVNPADTVIHLGDIAKHVAYWQVKHGTFFLVLQDMKLEQQGRFTMYWFPIRIDVKTG